MYFNCECIIYNENNEEITRIYGQDGDMLKEENIFYAIEETIENAKMIIEQNNSEWYYEISKITIYLCENEDLEKEIRNIFQKE